MPALYDAHSIFLNFLVRGQPTVVGTGSHGIGYARGEHRVAEHIPNMIEDGESGTLVPAADPSAMAKAARVLLEQPARARLMAQRAEESLVQYDWSTVGPAG